MTESEMYELGGLIKPLSRAISHLTLMQRTTLLLSLLAQEICLLPPGERQDALADVIAVLPRALDATEQGMRIALAANARGEG